MVLGGGTGGTLTANRLRRRFEPADAELHVVDRDDLHVYQPGLLFVPFGLADPGEIVRPRRRQLHAGIEFHESDIESVDLDANRVRLADGDVLHYDALVVATGARLLPEETEGLTGDGWLERVFTFYDLEGAVALREALASFDGGRLVVNIADMPIKCPVAPIEFTFLADWFLRERGVRGKTELMLSTPLDGCFTKPVASKHLTHLLEEKGVALVTEFSAGEVDGVGGKLVSYDGREIPFDLLVTVPSPRRRRVHRPLAGPRRRARLRPDRPAHAPGPARRRTSSRSATPTDVPTSKAGSVTHFEGELLDANIARYLAGDELEASFDGHANCFVETGFHKALLIDFNYDTEPLPGRFPTALGPLPLMRESRLNHLGKLMFQWFYWHVLLPGREIPGIGPAMPTAGKQRAA